MTILAYLDDIDSAYVRTFRAAITARPPAGLVLDRTYFYPAGGGQASDRGWIIAGGRQIAVVDVVKSGSAVVHRLRGPARGSPQPLGLTSGQEVEGSLDWDRRFRHMRLHSGQHLLSARIFAKTGLRTRRATFEDRSGIIELDGAWPSGMSMEDLEEDIRACIRESRAVRVNHVDRTDWDAAPDPRTGLVPLPAHLRSVRLIEIDGIDRCPCGGTHVRSTSEVGALSIELLPQEKGDSRVVFTLDGGVPPTPSE